MGPRVAILLLVLLAAPGYSAPAAVLADIASFKADPLAAGSLDTVSRVYDFAVSSPLVNLHIDEADLPWLEEPLDRRLRSILYGAYVVGDVEKQLQLGAAGEQRDAALRLVVAVYKKIRARYPEFSSPSVERLASVP